MKSTVEATSYGSASARAHQHTKAPPGSFKRESGHCELERLQRSYDAALNNPRRRTVTDEANAELASWRRQAKPVSDGISLEQVLIQDGEGHSAEMVGERYGLSPHHVRRIRKRNDRHMNDGTRLTATKDTMATEPRRAEVQRMRTKSMSNRQIAFVLHCSEGTVRNDIKALNAR